MPGTTTSRMKIRESCESRFSDNKIERRDKLYKCECRHRQDLVRLRPTCPSSRAGTASFLTARACRLNSASDRSDSCISSPICMRKSYSIIYHFVPGLSTVSLVRSFRRSARKYTHPFHFGTPCSARAHRHHLIPNLLHSMQPQRLYCMYEMAAGMGPSW